MQDTSFGQLATPATPALAQPSKGRVQQVNDYIGQFFKPAGDVVGNVLGGIGGTVAHYVAPKYEQAARQGAQAFGEALPRLATEAALTGGKKILPKLVGFGDVALRSYNETDPNASMPQRLAATAAQTGAWATMPKAGEAAANTVSSWLPQDVSRFTRIAARRGGSAIGTLSAMEAGNAASAAVQGQTYNPFTPEHIAGLAAGVLPFEALGLYGDIKTPEAQRADQFVSMVAGKKAAEQVLNTEQQEHPAPEVGTPDVKPAPVVFKGWQQNVPGKPPIALWNVTEDAPGLPKGSTVLNQTIEKAGFQVPEPPDMGAPKAQFQQPYPDETIKGFGIPAARKINGEQVFNRVKNVMGENSLQWDVINKDEFKKFLAEPRSGDEVSKWLDENAPKVGVHSYGMEGKVSEAKKEYDEMTHEMETSEPGLLTLAEMRGRGDTWQEIADEYSQSRGRGQVALSAGRLILGEKAAEVKAKVDQYNNLKTRVAADEASSDNPRATSYYNTVSAHDPKEVKRYGGDTIRIDWLLPHKPGYQSKAELASGDNWKTDEQLGRRWKSETSIHETAHTLGDTGGWAMGQILTYDYLQAKAPHAIEQLGLKPGEKILHIQEVQDHHIQNNHDGTYSLRMENYSKKYNSWSEANKALVAKYPILKDRQRLTIKAALSHIQELNAKLPEGQKIKRLVVSDAETAMMTEGHDKVPTVPRATRVVYENNDRESIANRYNNLQEQNPDKSYTISNDGKQVLEVMSVGKKEIIQEPGMRLNYDTILPKIAEELTGSKGERVSLGEHKNAFVDKSITDEAGMDRKQRDNLIFRNPDGTPKTDVSGRLYDLSKVRENLSILGRDKPLPPVFKQMVANLEPYGYDPIERAGVVQKVVDKQPLPNESYEDYVARLAGLPEDVFKRPQSSNIMLASLERLMKTHAEEILGMGKEDADWFTRKSLDFANMVGRDLKGVKVLPATSWHEGNTIQGSHFFMPQPAPNLQGIIGLLTKHPIADTMESQVWKLWHGVGHEFFHAQVAKAMNPDILSPRDAATQKAVQNIMDAAKDWSTIDMEKMVQNVMQNVGFEGDLTSYRSKYYTPNALGREEALADIYGLLAIGMMKDNMSTKDLLRFGGEDFRNVAKGMFKNVGAMWDAMSRFFKALFKGDLKGWNDIRKVTDNAKKIMKSVKQAEVATDLFLNMNEVRSATPSTPTEAVSYKQLEDYWAKLGDERYDPEFRQMVQDASTMVVPQKNPREVKELPIHLRFIDHFVTMTMLPKIYPQLADMQRLGFMKMGTVKNIVTEIQEDFRNFKTGRYDAKAVKRITNAGDVTNKAFNKIGLAQNALEGARKGQRLTQDEMMQIPEYANLKPEDRQFVNQMLDNFSSANMRVAKIQINSHKNVIGNMVGHIFQSHDRTMKWDRAKELGDALTTIHVDKDRLAQDPMADPQLAEQVQAANKKLVDYMAENPRNQGVYFKAQEPFTLDDKGMPLEAGVPSSIVLDYHQNRSLLLGAWLPPDKDTPQWHFEGRPGFMSEMRLGKFILAWKKKGEEPQLVGIQGRQEYNKRYKELADQFNKDSQLPDAERQWEYFKGADKDTESDLMRGTKSENFALYNKAMTNLVNRVTYSLGREYPETEGLLAQLRDELKPTSEMVRLMEAPWLRERQLIGGRETVNMPEAQIAYVNSVVNTVAKRELRGQQSLYMNDPKMRAQPELQQVARKYFKEIMDPTEKGFSKLKSLVFFNYCMFSPSLAFIEFTQQLTNHAPALINAGMKFGEAYKGIKQANVDYVNAVIRGHKDKSGKNIYANPQETEAVDRYNKAHGTHGYLQEVFHNAEDTNFLEGRSTMTGEPNIFDRNGLIGKPWYHMYKIGVKAHDMAIHINNEVAMLSAYRHFDKLYPDITPAEKMFGKTKQRLNEKAYLMAESLTHESMLGGGRANRPLWYLGQGPLNPGTSIGGLMYSLQMYVYGTLSQQARYLSDSIARSGLKPEQVSQARKAAATMIATQMFFAGIMGLPFSSQGIALIEQFFPSSQPKRRMREAFYGAGEWLNSKLHIFAQDEDMGSFVADAAVDGLVNTGPIDIGNRYELGGLMGVSPYGGFDWKNMLGPTGSMLQQIVKAGQDAGTGNGWQAARDLIPNNQVRRLVQLAADGFDVRNKDERLNVQLTNAEKVLLAAGFTPSKVTEFRDINAMKQRADNIQSQAQRKFHQQVAEMVLNGQTQQASQALWQHAQETPMYSPQDGARQVAQIVQDRTVPYNPVRQGSMIGDTYKAGDTFQQEPQVSETQRLMDQVGITKQLGFPQNVTRTQVKEAQLIDKFMSMYPTMSRIEAKQIIERQFHMGALQKKGVVNF